MSQAVKATIVGTAEYYGRQLSETVLTMYAEDLADLEPALVCQAYTQYRRNPKNKTFPLPAQIREIVVPDEFVSSEAKAREIAARIVGAIPKFGWNNSREAESYIGLDGWELVRRAGGWRYLCENVGVAINPSTLQAQMRDQLEGTFRYGRGTIGHAISIGERESTPSLESAGDIVKRLTQAINPQTEPDGAA